MGPQSIPSRPFPYHIQAPFDHLFTHIQAPGGSALGTRLSSGAGGKTKHPSVDVWCATIVTRLLAATEYDGKTAALPCDENEH
jgi:hypothetical protein